jgi:hypothetical protein
LIEYLKKAQDTTNNKVLLFSSSLNTIDYLKESLSEALPNLRIKIITGSTEKDKRSGIRKDFELLREEKRAVDLLICSEIGSEGLDLQFCNKMVNYDIPWNPMKIEQRIGRIDRRGQQSPLVNVISFLTVGTVEEQMYSRCFDRIALFNQHIGGLEHVIGDIDKKVTKILFTDDLSASTRKAALDEIFREVEEEKSKLDDCENGHIRNDEYDDTIISAKDKFNNLYTFVVRDFLKSILNHDIVQNEEEIVLTSEDSKILFSFLTNQNFAYDDSILNKPLNELESLLLESITAGCTFSLYPSQECSLFQLFLQLAVDTFNLENVSIKAKSAKYFPQGEYIFSLEKTFEPNSLINPTLSLYVYNEINKSLFVVEDFNTINDFMFDSDIEKDNIDFEFCENFNILHEDYYSDVRKMHLGKLEDKFKKAVILSRINTHNEYLSCKKRIEDYEFVLNDRERYVNSRYFKYDNKETQEEKLKSIANIKKVLSMEKGIMMNLKRVFEEKSFEADVKDMVELQKVVLAKGKIYVK